MTEREYILDDGAQSYILTADEGNDIVRISDNFNFGREVWLGYRYNKDGSKVLELPEDFTEVEHINTEDYEEDKADN